MGEVEDRLREIRERWDDVERVTGVGRPDDEDGFGCGAWWDADGESVECRWWDRKARDRALRAPADIAYLLAEIDRLRSADEHLSWLRQEAEAVGQELAAGSDARFRAGYAQAREQAAALCAKRGASIHPLSERDLRHVADAIRTMTPGDGGEE